MEFTAAILTALFFWIFVYYCLTDSLHRARQAAGRPLLVVKYPHGWARCVHLVISLVFSVVGALVILVIMPRDLPRFPGAGFLLAMTMFGVFMLMFASAQVTRQLLIGLELREHGVIGHYGWRAVLPWEGIKYCEWTAKPGILRIQRHRSRFSEKYRIDPEQMREVTAILVRQVEVRDATGTIPEDELRRPEVSSERSDKPAEVTPARFQFTLTALFLLLLAASAAFSWFGIRYRRDQRQSHALERLGEFSPGVFWFLGSLQLDFSKCREKPTDADLVPLADIYQLRRLDLSGCPVTDAGLKHLHTLHNLHYIGLSNTAVTDAGVEELQRALPDANISRD